METDKLTLTNLDMVSIKSLSQAFKESGLFPDIEGEAQAVVKIVAGQELGLPPVYSMQNFYIIRGKISMAAETMGLLIKRTGKYNYRVMVHTDQECQIQFYENGKDIYLSNFTTADAKRAGLVKPDSGWIKYPKAMLFSRAMSQGTRIVAPELMGSAHTIEEIEGISPDALGEIEAAPQPEVKRETKKAKKTKGDLPPADVKIKPEKSAEIAPSEEEIDNTPPEGPLKFKRDPSSIKDIAGLYQALWMDYRLQPDKVMAELNIKSNNEIVDTPPDCYIKVATIYGVRGD